MKYPKYPSFIIHLKQILHSLKTKAEIETGNAIEYGIKSCQVKNTIVKYQKYNWNNCNLNAHRKICWWSQCKSDVYNTPIKIIHRSKKKAELGTGNTIEYEVKSYQVKKTIVKSTKTKTATSFTFPELHANKLINKWLHVVNPNINRYDMFIGRYLIRFLGINIHGAGMTIHWENAAIPLHDIYSTTNNVFALSHYNAHFQSETKRKKRILDAKYSKANIKTIA